MAFEVPNGMTAADPRVRYVLALMERHCAEPLSIAALARAVNLSPAHLRRMFQQELGKSPSRVWRELRLDRARHLLQNSFLTVKQVMAQSGWNDPSHFCREFKRRHGDAPRALRQGTIDDLMLDDEVRR
jgi:AraC family transcriptional regulator, carnitine catabolism transcriptional activator